ncbi:GNAT family N-acetyltransferase [Streptomyces sp. CA-111067]|uniref:GNAT family N-acetyltransferase n=1 Tax=Streptomyces sp. CA-111067 TaxID=3240046 RepID=UPI003D978B84
MEYRTATPADEPALHALWTAAFPDPAPVIALWSQDPGRHRRTFVAVDDGGRPVSVVHYQPRPIRSSTGEPQQVGCLGSVATHPEARGRGHVRRLLAAAVATMTADGCAWSLLFTSTPAVYENAGWRTFAAPGWSGPPADPAPDRLAPAGPVTVRPAIPADLPALQELRATFDASRPLTTVRTAEDWQHRVPVWYAPPTETLLAETDPEAAPRPAGFLVVRHPRPGHVEIAEIALAPGHGADVAGALFAFAGARARDVGAWGVGVRLPAVRAVREALPLLLAEVTAAPTRFGMARALGATVDEVVATVSAPGAVHWYGDSF